MAKAIQTKKKFVKNSISVDGVSFNKDFVSGFKSEADFLAAMGDDTHKHIFEGDNREAKLKSVYAAVGQQLGTVAPEATKEAPAKGSKK